MTPSRSRPRCPAHTAHRGPFRPRDRRAGYLIVLFVVVLAFVGVAAGMQVLVLTSVATASRAYDAFRQGATELSRLEKIVAETVLEQRQISVAVVARTLPDALAAHLLAVVPASERLTATHVPATLPTVVTFPDPAAPADALTPLADDVEADLGPELRWLVGPRAAAYPTASFDFAGTRVLLDVERDSAARVVTRLLAVPLTRFPVAAYDLPAEIGQLTGAPTPPAASATPRGLVPGRDAAFVSALQASPGVLPYSYRSRAVLAAAYQFVFSQSYVDRASEYAGITHFRRLDAAGQTADLAGLAQVGSSATWDLALAGSGTYGTVTLTRDCAVIFAEAAGYTLQLHDNPGSVALSPLLLLLLGPSDPRLGPLNLQIAAVARPVVIVGCNIRVVAAAGSALNGALFLDPASTLAPGPILTVGHLSFWAGSPSITPASVATAALPAVAEALAPRVVYVSARASRL